MIINNVTLEAVAVAKSGFPEGLPEAALCGRSNVGKSSLINTMTGRKALARISQTPGKTRTINFYNVENALYLVDLPGYGYAKAAKTESQKWGKMIEGYLKDRPQLKAISLLLDIRHKPTENDKIMYDFIRHYGYKAIGVATKVDKVSRSQLPARLKELKETLAFPADVPLVPFSSKAKQGRDELWGAIFDALGVRI